MRLGWIRKLAMGSACSESCGGHAATATLDCSGGSAGAAGRVRPEPVATVIAQGTSVSTPPIAAPPPPTPPAPTITPAPIKEPAQAARAPAEPKAPPAPPSPAQPRPPSECPICYAASSDVEPLPHKTASGDVTSHRACRKCREELVTRNSPCPWCRTEMVWQTVFGVLDGLKGATRGYRDGQHDELANLMGMWQEYEMCRTQSDICLFAREMATDPAVVARLEGALITASGWLRDSAGLWIRFYALYADGETQLSTVDGERLRRAVDGAIESFERDHGGHPDFVGAMYQQAAVAVLSASFSGLSTRTAALLARRVGEAALRVFRRHYGAQPRSAAQVRERLHRDYAEAVSQLVWGTDAGGDPIMRAFFGG